jgi:formylglycine-generating enzyme
VTESGETGEDRAAPGQDLWCRLERDGERVVGVGLMHPDGKVLVFYPAERFGAQLVKRMQTGHIRARLSAARFDGGRTLRLKDESGRIVFSEDLPGATDAKAPLPAPETVLVPAGRLAVRTADGTAWAIEVASFRIGRTPVTNREYGPFLDSGRAAAPPWWSDPQFRAPLQPVVGVTWGEAMAYCEWIAETAGGRWRLPTEAEWEFAAGGGLAAPKTAWGESIPPGEIPAGPIAGPWETGRGTPNGFGLCDPGTMVHEWCLNWFEPEPLPSASGVPAHRRRASRGGSWRHEIRWSSPSALSSLPPDYRYSDFGFRVLRERDR